MSENLRIGVFVCDCGSNIAGAVDTETVRQFASGLAMWWWRCAISTPAPNRDSRKSGG